MLRLLLLLFVTAWMSNSALANTYTVTRTIDNTNTGTLRWAITQANLNAGYDVINFAIDPAVTGNTFENDGAGNSWAVITLTSALPTITQTLLIDGGTQFNTNTGFIAGRTVGVDEFVQGNINYPDVYITCGYTLPTNDGGVAGNGLSINSVNVTIRGLAISGFGNTNINPGTAIAHADIALLYASADRTMNTVISDCFISCSPRGALPATAIRRTKSNGIVILGNNNNGQILRNYVAHSGMYGIVFHAQQDNNTSTSPNVTSSSNWVVEQNQVSNIGTNTSIVTNNRASDGISMMTVTGSTIRYNYIQNWEQFAIDLGHNTDNNIVSNNTATNFTSTNGTAPCGGIRTGFSSELNTVTKNVVNNNTSASFLAGIYSDEAITSLAGAATKNNSGFTFSFNRIHNNVGSGITLSTNGAGTVTGVTISQNEIYENVGLGIDLGYTDLTGPVRVTVNDDGDGDSGPNNLQNFPVIDNARFNALTNELTIWGKAPAGSTLEFFTTDGQVNNHGLLGLNYGEGKKYLGTGIEGSTSDAATGTGSYNMDGNIATNNVNLFQFSFIVTGITINTDMLTATATVSGNTSEFGPTMLVSTVLNAELFNFSGVKDLDKIVLRWEAACDRNFSHFEVERSNNGNDYINIGTVSSQATSQRQLFSFTDDLAGSVDRYYRLRMVNINGQSKFSKVVGFPISQSTAEGVNVFPNPFVKQITLRIELREKQQLQLSLVDVHGNMVYTRFAEGMPGKNQFLIEPMMNLPKGMYTMVIRYDGKQILHKVVCK